MNRCPTCNSPSPGMHPAVQWEGEVEICIDSFHEPIFAVQMARADKLRHAVRYIADQFRLSFTREQAQANLQARNILLRAGMKILDEAVDLIPKAPAGAA